MNDFNRARGYNMSPISWTNHVRDLKLVSVYDKNDKYFLHPVVSLANFLRFFAILTSLLIF